MSCIVISLRMHGVLERHLTALKGFMGAEGGAGGTVIYY